MYEHPYLMHRVTELDTERLVRDAERRRFIEEHADQIVRRPEGALRRMLRRLLGGAAGADAVAPRRGAAPCGEPAAAR